MTASPAATFAARLVEALVDEGVSHAVVSPGSRSQALALALAAAEADGRVTLHVRIDERVAGFTALGLARESGRPAVVVTTSGTAVANLLPAVVEANHSGVPMIVLTADRPASLRGTGSNQTTVQPGMFGSFTRAEVDVEAPTAGAIPDARSLARFAMDAATRPRASGAVHLNLQFVEPLSGEVDEELPVRPWTAPQEASATRAELRPMVLERGPRTLVIAGADAGEVANDAARAAGWPLIAEVSSGARFGPNVVGTYRQLLDHSEFGGRVERALVFGHPTLSRQVPALLGRDDVEVIVVESPTAGAAFRPAGSTVVDAVEVPAADPDDRAARAWTGQWIVAGRELLDEADAADDVAPPEHSDTGTSDVDASRAYARTELAALNAPITRRALVLAAWRASWPHDRLVLGASRLIRVLDESAPGKRIPVHANRGLAGIDGTVSTAIGVAAAAASAAASASEGAGARGRRMRVGTTRVLLGDLALLHDVGGLMLTPGEAVPRVQLVVGNDGGGTIFDGLEVAGTAASTAFDRVLYTPQSVDVAALAAAYGWSHRRVDRRGELDSALASPAPGCSVVEVALDR